MALQRLGVVQALEGQFADGRLALEEAVLLTGGVKSTAALSLSYLALISSRSNCGRTRGSGGNPVRPARRVPHLRP
jgi:hypothetical protein